MQLDACFLCHAGGLQGALEGVRHAAESIVRLLGGAIQTQAHADHACLAEFVKIGMNQAVGGGGAQGHAQAFPGGAFDDVEYVSAHHGVATGQHQHGRVQLGYFVYQGQGFLVVQFLRVTLRLGYGSAVPAGQCTSARYLPEQDERTVSKIAHGRMVGRSHARIVHARALLGKSRFVRPL